MIRQYFLLFLVLFSSSLFAQNFDINTLRSINLHRNENLDTSFKHITNSYAVVSIGAPLTMYAVGLINKDVDLQKNAIFIGESVAASVFITIVLKETIKTERPFVTYPEIEKLTSAGGYSMPSAHTSIAFATATSLSMAYPKWYVIAPSFVWASAVGYSRMHLGVHYPSDVVAGALIGSGSAYLTYKINKWMNKKRRKEGL
ncbi:phosphatase PAP2 family protein [Flavobacterium succinicans]|uniref:Putative undecaprenyl-diphosphatase YbjG n=1 Tax=Flavobacterium succinicans TaxID=29536 RepID=A0A199XTR1_9FLAO|nr:phosphatase PAP2 family protein [Flavobacterium succinicans]OAZ05148.1 putative undecaprenyl-diphosphatase YbjG [Flavobacterium succinicans]